MSKKNIYGLTYNELCKHFDNELLVNLPKTKFPIRVSAARELQIQEVIIVVLVR